MLRFAVALALTGCLVSDLRAGLCVQGTIVSVSETGFVLQTKKGLQEFKADELPLQLRCAPSPYGEGWDLINHLKVADLREGMEVVLDLGTLKGKPICKGIKPKAHAEINFEPLANADRKFTLQLTLSAVDGTKQEITCGFEAGTPVQDVRDRFVQSLQPTPRSTHRWAVFAVAGWEDHLVIDGYIRGEKFKVIEKVELKCSELPPESQPLVRQKGEPWPTRDK
jgi:hypothetical protein